MGRGIKFLMELRKKIKFNGPLLASKFFLLWPFIVGTLNYMPMARREKFRTSIKRTTAKVVRGLVKHFQLKEFEYPINYSQQKNSTETAGEK